MSESARDHQQIADLMTGWMHRDLAEWDLLRGLFARDARIEITWFSGLASDFVDASARMGASPIVTKHFIASPVVQYSTDGTHAISETNAIIVAQNDSLKLGSQTHSRFIDRLRKVEGEWRIADRRIVYDFSSYTFPRGIVDIDQQLADSQPAEYAALAYILSSGGFPVSGAYATKGSAVEYQMKDAAVSWLTGEES